MYISISISMEIDVVLRYHTHMKNDVILPHAYAASMSVHVYIGMGFQTHTLSYTHLSCVCMFRYMHTHERWLLRAMSNCVCVYAHVLVCVHAICTSVHDIL